jgi:hypothetical protein
VVSGRGQLHWVDEDEPWRGARWGVASADGRRYPLTLSMLLFDSSGVSKDAAVDEHRAALGDWLMANWQSPDSAAIELRSGRIDDAALIVRAAAAGARLRRAEPGLTAGLGAGHGH